MAIKKTKWKDYPYFSTSKIEITWWVSSKSFNIQGGDEKYIEKLQKKIDRLIQKREESISEENSNSKPSVKQGRIGTYNFVVPGLSEPLF